MEGIDNVHYGVTRKWVWLPAYCKYFKLVCTRSKQGQYIGHVCDAQKGGVREGAAVEGRELYYRRTSIYTPARTT